MLTLKYRVPRVERVAPRASLPFSRYRSRVPELAFAAILGVLSWGATASFAAPRAVYLSDDLGTVVAANPDGSELAIVFEGDETPLRIGFDAILEAIWISNPEARTVTSRPMNRDDAKQEEVGPTIRSRGRPMGIDVDVLGGKVYWADNERGTIERANFDGTDAETVVRGLEGPHDVVIDANERRIYFSMPRAGAIGRARLERSDAELVLEGIGQPESIALDSRSEQIYWTDPRARAIRRASIGAADTAEIYVRPPVPPTAIAFDPTEGQVYWAAGGRLFRSSSSAPDADAAAAAVIPFDAAEVLVGGFNAIVDIELDVLEVPFEPPTPSPPPSREIELSVDSGAVENVGGPPGAIFDEVVRVPGATWLRLYFGDVLLAGNPLDPKETDAVVRITSLLDGAVQEMGSLDFASWDHSTAYFNGDALRIEIVAHPQTGPSRVLIDRASAGEGPEGAGAGICPPGDDRVLSSDRRVARIWPIGCTAWLINDANKCFLSAGHCAPIRGNVCMFNVPPPPASLVPGPQDQYPVDPASVQWEFVGIGDDWMYFGCFPNAQGFTAYERQGSAFSLGTAPATGDQVVVTGYGRDSDTPVRSFRQQTDVGPYGGSSGTTAFYAADVEGGNSGGPVIDGNRGVAIVTHSGCSSIGNNHGTLVTHPRLQTAIANPLGICSDQFVTLVEVENTTEEWASDLHITFGNTGGMVSVDPNGIIAPGCPAPTVSSNGMMTSTVNIDWGVPCVPPNGWVSFLLLTPNGPPNFISGNWTGPGGVVIGPVDPAWIILTPLPHRSGWIWSLRQQTRYVPLGPISYTPWFKPPGRCWTRICCSRSNLCQVRLILCLSRIGPGRVIGRRRCRAGPWRNFGVIGWMWVRQVTTKNPFKVKNPGLQIEGPPPDDPTGAFPWSGDWSYSTDVQVSHDGLSTLRPSADLASTFLGVFRDLEMVIGDSFDPNDPPRQTFEELVALLGERYRLAGANLTPLIDEIARVLDGDPSPELRNLRSELAGIREAMLRAAEAMFDGRPVDSRPFRSLGEHFRGLGGAISGLRSLFPELAARFANAADDLFLIAVGYDTAANAVDDGLVDIPQRDTFLWGLIARALPLMYHAARAMDPHVRVQLDLGETGWSPLTARAQITVRDRDSGAVIDELMAKVSEMGTVDIPLDGINETVTVRIKVATYRGVELAIEPRDGARIGPIRLSNGDVNGDDSIDNTDLAIVIADLGAGGEFAAWVPPSDLNRDGVVTALDVAIVEAGIGEREEAIADVLFVRGDANSDGSIELTDAVNVLSGLFLGTEGIACLDAADADGSGSVEMNDAVLILGWRFGDGPPPSKPAPDGPTYSADACGPNLSTGGLGCETTSPTCR